GLVVFLASVACVDGDVHFPVVFGLGHRDRVLALLDRHRVLVVQVLDGLAGRRVDRVRLAGLRVHFQWLAGDRVLVLVRLRAFGLSGLRRRRRGRRRDRTAAAGGPATTGAAATAASGVNLAAATVMTGRRGRIVAALAVPRRRERIRIEPFVERIDQRVVVVVDPGNEVLALFVDGIRLRRVVVAELLELVLGVFEDSFVLLGLLFDVVLGDAGRQAVPDNGRDRVDDRHDRGDRVLEEVDELVPPALAFDLVDLVLEFLDERRQLFIRVQERI